MCKCYTQCSRILSNTEFSKISLPARMVYCCLIDRKINKYVFGLKTCLVSGFVPYCFRWAVWSPPGDTSIACRSTSYRMRCMACCCPKLSAREGSSLFWNKRHITHSAACSPGLKGRILPHLMCVSFYCFKDEQYEVLLLLMQEVYQSSLPFIPSV